MPMFAQRRQLRRLAGHLLLLWLLALSTGIVNACVVGPEGRHAGLLGVQAVQTVHDGHAADGTGHHTPDTQPDNAACVAFCGDVSTTVPAVKAAAADLAKLCSPPLTDPSFDLQAALAAVGVAGAEPGPMQARVPISIAFLRLRL